MRFIRLRNFIGDDSGAITVDWVVLTAALVGIAIAMVSIISAGVMEAASEIEFVLTEALT